MEARRKPVLVPESATPNLDAAQRYAARGTPLVGDMADLEIGQQEDVATQRVAAAEVQPHLRGYLDNYARNLDVAYRAMQDPDNFDRGQALGGIMQNLTNDIDQIPADYDGPLRQEMVDLYTQYATKAKLATMTDADGVAELERDTKLFPGVKTALARFRTEHKPKEAVPPPSVAQTGEGIDRHLQATLATMSAMSRQGRRLHAAEMSAAVQNMRGAPLAAQYVRPIDAVDASYMAEVEHSLLRNRKLKRRGMRKSVVR
jgi:hypothetical protein